EYDAYGKEGKWLHLDDKGRLLREENYSKGKLDGDFVLYYPETQVVKMTTHYAAGIQSGAHTSFYADAKKDTVSFYNAGGMRDGKMTVYLADGTVCYEATFVNGIPTGTSKRWYDNHQLMEVDNFDSNGQPDDTCLVYYENGQTKSVSVYSHGTREGKWTAWYANGKKQSEANYRKGRKTGTFSDWNSSGILVSQASYKNDTLNGSCKTFYGSGTAKTDYRYTMGIRDGKCTRYDTSGNVTFTRTYAKGKPLNYSPPRKIPGASRCTPDPASPFSLCDSLQEAFHNEAVFIAMRTMWTDSAWKDSVVVRESMIRSIERSLVAVWNFLPPGSFGFTWEYGLPRENGLHELSITYTDKDSFNQAVYNNWKNGKGETGISGIDRILKKYSLTLVPNTFYAYQNEFSVSYTTPLVLNFRGLTAELQKADGHFAAYTSWGTAGDGDHVYQQRKGNITLLTFSHGYGDCPSGCMGRENFVFIVYDDGEVETGDRIRAMSPYLRRN
ncbi:MAG TPA: toxin-antitoxin system YwqK family antitoxin, partial [Bacteroidia bacterium]|nr:toxin-antitoxin system YwqK family antitoxin [Bacteroidia bacterium]